MVFRFTFTIFDTNVTEKDDAKATYRSSFSRSLKGVFSDFMIDAVKITHDPLIPEMVLFFQISTSGQRGSLSGMMKTSQTTSISSQTTSNQPLKPDLFLPNHIVHLPNHICYLSNHITYLSNQITYLSNQIVPLPNQIILLSNHIMIWFGRFSGCRKCYAPTRNEIFKIESHQ